MHSRASIRLLLVVSVLTLGMTAVGDDEPLDTIRLLTILPRTFDYRFMSYMSDGTERYQLVFNTADGETIRRRPGEAIGNYTIATFTPITERAFTPSVQAKLTRKSGRVDLVAPDGERFELTMGQPLRLDGWTACLVDLRSGDWLYVNTDDRFIRPDGTTFHVVAVTEHAVILHDGTIPHQPPVIEEAEHKILTALWEARDQQRRDALAKASREPEPDPLQAAIPVVRRTPPPPPRREMTIRSGPPRFMFGTDYPYPTAFQVVRMPVRTASGQIVYRYVSVPVRFERRIYGMGYFPGSY